MKRNLLIVTDHKTHAESNSLYELAASLSNATSWKVYVSSRSVPSNKIFFDGLPEAEIYAASVDDNFTYERADEYFSKDERLDPHYLHAILVRMPQPLNANFLHALKKIVPPSRIINHPDGTIESSSKAFLLQVAHLCPNPVLCRNIDEAIALTKQHEIVLKPLYSYGGHGLMRLSKDFFWVEKQRLPLEEMQTHIRDMHFPMVAMRYLKHVDQGDKRTIVVNQQILGSAIRYPGQESWICNIASGGHAILSEPDEDELRIEHELTPLLYKKGVIMYGFDTLVDDDGRRVLSEINTLSIGGIEPIQELSGKPIVKDAADLIWSYLEQ